MRSRVFNPAGPVSSYLKASYPIDAANFLKRIRYHLLKNILPTLLIVIISSAITLLLSGQIEKAKLIREEPATASSPQTSQGSPSGDRRMAQ